VARANSSRALLRATSGSSSLGRHGRGPPLRSASGGLRPLHEHEVVNTRIEPVREIQRKHSNRMLAIPRGPHGILQRDISELSLGGAAQDDLSLISEGTDQGSLFTMDSVALRKTQLVADPIEEGTYCPDDMSFADHESVYTSQASDLNLMGGYDRYGLERQESAASILSFNTLDSLRFDDRLQLNGTDETSANMGSVSDSFGTLGSGITTDFTESFAEHEATEGWTERGNE
jgi:hypothetical protein